MIKMKKMKVWLFLGAIAIAVLMVSSVTAVPQTQSIPYNEYLNDIDELEEKLEEIKQSRQFQQISRIVDRYITEEHHELIRQTFLEQLTNSTLDGGELDGIIELLVDWCIIFIEVTAIIFGHNVLSVGIGYLLFSIFAFIPKMFISIVGGGIVYWNSLASIDGEDIFEDWGILGMIIFAIIILPIVLIGAVVLIPIYSIAIWIAISMGVLDGVQEGIDWW